jgi:hypothetical protein
LRPTIEVRELLKTQEQVRGGGKTKSKTKELAEDEMSGIGGPIKSSAEISTALGITKTITPVTTGSFGWQHATLQSIAAFRP